LDKVKMALERTTASGFGVYGSGAEADASGLSLSPGKHQKRQMTIAKEPAGCKRQK
jgi:hypothetical protein